MAGIGFELKTLAGRRGMLAPITSLGHATVIAAGPWLLTVIALSLIQARVSIETEARGDAIQTLIIYGFCLSLVATAPVVAVAVKIASDRIYLGCFGTLSTLFVRTTLGSTACGLLLAGAVFGPGFGIGGPDLVLAMLMCGILSAMWPAIAFCGMARRYGVISGAFVLGLVVSLVLTFLAERLASSAAVEALAFALGLGLTTIVLQSTFFEAFPRDDETVAEAAAGPLRHGLIALGASFSALSLWVDSWIMWASPLAVVSTDGLPTAPFYDSIMFIARILMVPALAFFVIWVETSVFDSVRCYIATIRGTGTLDRIERRAGELRMTILRMFRAVMLVQLLASCALALLAHAVIDAMGLLFQQGALLRNGAIGAFFHLAFICATTILLFLDRILAFTVLQALFLALNLVLTGLTVALAPEMNGLGYLAAAAVASVAAVLTLEATTDDFVALTFSQANPVGGRPLRAPPRMRAGFAAALSAVRSLRS